MSPSARSSMLLFVFAFLAVGTPIVLGAPPAPTSVKLQFRTIKADRYYRVFTAEVCFDQDLYVFNATRVLFQQDVDSRHRIDDALLGGQSADDVMPYSVIALQHTGTLAFSTDIVATTTLTDNDGPPDYLMATFAGRDSAASFGAALGGARFVNDEIFSDCIGFVLLTGMRNGPVGDFMQFPNIPLSEAQMTEQVDNGQVTLTLLPGVLHNENNETATTNTVLTLSSDDWYEPECTFRGGYLLEQLASEAQAILQNTVLETKQDVERLGFLVGSFETRNTLQKCSQLIGHFAETVTRNATRTGTECRYADGSFEWLADPCCNYELEFTQCCAPRSYTYQYYALGAVNETAIEEKCYAAFQSDVADKLLDYAIQVNKERPPIPRVWDVVDSRMGVFEKCQSEVYGATCNRDQDCLSGKCSNSQCVVPWGDDAALMVRCVVEEIEELQDGTFESLLAYYRQQDNSIRNKPQLIRHLFELATEEGCVGPDSWEYNRRTEWDDGEETDIPADLVGCVARQKCSWTWDDTMTEAECLQPTPTAGSHVCVRCDGSNCYQEWSASDAYCQVPYNDQASCEAASMFWHSDRWTCIHPTATDRASCLGPQAAWCPRPYWFNEITQKDDYASGRCSSSHGWIRACVLDPAVVGNSSDCTNWWYDGGNNNYYGTHWFDELRGGDGLCGVYLQDQSEGQAMCDTLFAQMQTDSYAPAATATGLTFFGGVDNEWHEGRFDTEAKCSRGKCNYQNPFEAPADFGNLDADDCTSLMHCTERKPACVQNSFPGRNLCVAKTNPDSSVDCDSIDAAKSGWYTFGDVQLCVLGYNTDEATCQSFNQSWTPTFMDCGVATSEAACAAGTGIASDLAPYCQWNKEAQPTNAQDCAMAGGQCDDWSYWGNTACRFTAPLNQDGWPECPEYVVGQSGANYTEVWGTWRLPGYCVAQGVSDSVGCADLNVGNITDSVRRLKAFTEADCLADQRCDYPYRRHNRYSPSECASCGASLTPAYTWTSGRWVAAEMEPLYWIEREMKSINSIGPALVPWDELVDIFILPALMDTFKTQYQDAFLPYNGLANTLTTMVCACTPGAATRDCNLDPRDVLLGISSGAAVDFVADGLGFRASGGDGASATSRRRLLDATSSDDASLVVLTVSEYSYTALPKDVLDGSGATVGQLVSNCYAINVTGAAAANLTIARRIDVDLPDAAAYNVPYIVEYDAEAARLAPVYVTDAATSATSGATAYLDVTTSQITSSGVYCYGMMSVGYVPVPPTPAPGPTPAPMTPEPSAGNGTTLGTSDASPRSPVAAWCLALLLMFALL